MSEDNKAVHIAAFCAAGFPPPLLIPCIPANLPPDGTEPGKTPARVTVHGGWANLKDWQNGVSPEVLAQCARAGANCGLRLGRPSGDCQFLFLDIDTLPNTDPEHIDSKVANLISRRVIASVQEHAGLKAVWVRKTRPGRAGILVRIPAGEIAGGKFAVKIHSAKDNTHRGKIELLADGQQAVVGGIHAFKQTPILWYRTDRPTALFRAPKLDDAMPLLKSRDAVNTLVDLITADLTAAGFGFGPRSSAANVTSLHELSAEEMAPPSAAKLVEVFDAMPNPESVDRDQYSLIMRAAVGCMRALAMCSNATEEELESIKNAAIRWAVRWKGVNKSGLPNDEETERNKWEEDWAKNPATRIPCWDFIATRAIAFGNMDLRYEQAQKEFVATEDYPLAPAIKERPPALLPTAYSEEDTEFVPKKRRPGLVDLPTADIQISDAIEQEHLGSIAAWINDEGRWIVFASVARGWSDPSGNQIVRLWIADALVTYVAKYGNDWTDSARVKLNSGARIDAIEKIMKDRLGIMSSKVNCDPEYLQTPGGAYNLATGERVKASDQRDLLDTRLTGVIPVAGETPDFDALMLHIACGDAEVVAWLWAYLGYMTIGRPLAHIMLVIHGPGGNGKGTLDRIIQHVLGTYAKAIDRSVVLESGRGKHETGLFDIKGARYWSVSELQANEKWNEAQVRSLTGGDPIKARGMHQNMQTVMPEGSFLITTNFLPSFHRIDEAIARRFRLIHARLKPKVKDAMLEDRIRKNEAPAILERIMAEARRVIANKYELPEIPLAMKAESARFFAEQDQFYSWFSSECDVTAATVDITFDELRSRYDAFVKRLNEHRDSDESMGGMMDAMPNAAFSAALRRAGAIVDDTSGRRLVRKVGDKQVLVVGGVQLKIRAAA